jgi:hypothetical protein
MQRKCHKKSSFFRDITPSSRVKVCRCLGGTYCFHLQDIGVNQAVLTALFMLILCMAYSSTLKLKMIWSSEVSADFYWTTLHWIPEDRTVHSHCCENPSYKIILYVWAVQHLYYYVSLLCIIRTVG